MQDGNIQTRFVFIAQLEERRQGNEKYKSRDLDGALHHYERALAIVDYVRGVSPAEQVMPSTCAAQLLGQNRGGSVLSSPRVLTAGADLRIALWKTDMPLSSVHRQTGTPVLLRWN